MQTTKLSDFLKQQGDTPQGKSTYQAFIDNFDKDYDAESFRKDEKGSIAAAFQWDICPEDLEFWNIVDNKWQEVTDPENDMLWLLDGKEPPQEADVEDELEERRRKEAVTPTKQPPILPIGTNKLLDTEETKELDETVKAADPFGYFEEPAEQKEYPRWFKYKSSKLVVEFDSLYDGTVVIGDNGYSIGDVDAWIDHTDTSVWQEVPNPELTQENEINNTDGKRKQIGGNHYAKHSIQPWDIIREYELDYFEGNALKYLLRQKDNRLEDLQKAAHYLEECIKNEQKRMDNV